RHADLGGADIARFAQQLGQVDDTLRVHVAHRQRADLERAGIRVDQARRLVDAEFERLCHQQRLDRRARLERIDDRAIAHALGQAFAGIVRVEARLRGDRQDFAGRAVGDDDDTAARLVLRDGVLDFPLGQVRDAQVDRQRDVLTRLRFAEVDVVLDDAALPVADAAALAGVTGQQRLLRLLDALEAGAFAAGEADQFTGAL